MSSPTNEVITFEDDKPAVPKSREQLALAFVKKALSSAAPEAVKFQRRLMNDEAADPGLRLKASEALLDRFMGKAGQEIRLGIAEDRPIVFSSKLQALREGFKAAEDAAMRNVSPTEAFVDKMVEQTVDKEGVTI